MIKEIFLFLILIIKLFGVMEFDFFHYIIINFINIYNKDKIYFFIIKTINLNNLYDNGFYIMDNKEFLIFTLNHNILDNQNYKYDIKYKNYYKVLNLIYL